VDEIKDAIIEKALILNPDLDDNPIFEQVVSDVVSRTLIYTGRYRLKEEQVPEILIDPLASVVVATVRGVEQMITADTNAISRIKDHGQEVVYSEKLQAYMGSADSDIFHSVKLLLDKFRIARVVENT
jgi:hypothetical protein